MTPYRLKEDGTLEMDTVDEVAAWVAHLKKDAAPPSPSPKPTSKPIEWEGLAERLRKMHGLLGSPKQREFFELLYNEPTRWMTDNEMRAHMTMTHRSALGGLFRAINSHAKKCGVTIKDAVEAEVLVADAPDAAHQQFRLTRQMREVMKEAKDETAVLHGS